MDNNVRKSSDARIRANRKYMEKTYKNLQVQVKSECYQLIDTYCKSMDISKAEFIVKCCKYVIDNEIDIK
jgi:hypothetical protein